LVGLRRRFEADSTALAAIIGGAVDGGN